MNDLSKPEHHNKVIKYIEEFDFPVLAFRNASLHIQYTPQWAYI